MTFNPAWPGDDITYDIARGESISDAGEEELHEAVAAIVAGEGFEGIVKEPKHYDLPGGGQAIDLIRELLGDEGFRAYCMGNVIKYAVRLGRKGNQDIDLAKIREYVNFYLA